MLLDSKKYELISQVLARLGQDRYDLEHDGEGEIVKVKAYGPTFDEMEEYFSNELESLEILRSEIEEEASIRSEAGFPLEDNWSSFWTQRLLKELFDPEFAKIVEYRLQGFTYGQVIVTLYEICTEGLRRLTGGAVRERESLSSAEMERLESILEALPASHAEDIVANEYALQLSGRFPKMVKRANSLRILPAKLSVPTEVQTYLTEATRCFVYGQFIACLLVCRSAIEFAVRDRIEKAGLRNELLAREHQAGRGLESLLEFGKESLPWQLHTTLDTAGIVKKEANAAVHQRTPTAERCKEMFDTTRGILRELFE